MHKNIETLLTIIANANDLFVEKYLHVSTTVGILDKSLQNSNAVTIDNIKLKQKLMFVILNANPNIVGVGTGKAGTEDFVFIEQYELNLLSVESVLELMEQYILV